MEKYVMKIIYILSLSASVANTNVNIGIKDKIISNCVVDIVKESSTNILISPFDITLVNIDDDLIISALHKVEGLRFITRAFLFDFYRIYNSAYIIKSDNPQELKDGLNQVIRDGQWNPKARYLIIVKNFKEHDMFYFRNLFFDYNIHNVFLITPKGRDYAIYQLNIISRNSCQRSNSWVLVSSCSEYLTKKSLPVVKNHENIRNCQFKFITHSLWPYTNYDNEKMKGIEQRIIKDYEKYNNIKIKLHVVTQRTDMHGVVIPGYTNTMLKRVQMNEFEGAVGGFNTINHSLVGLSFTFPVTVDQATFILAHAENLKPWEIVLSHPVGCITIFIILIILCMLTTLPKILTKQERDVTRDILLVIGYILNKTAVKNINPNLSQRIIFYAAFVSVIAALCD